MKIKNVEWVNNTGISQIVSPVVPYNDKIDGVSYIGLLMSNIRMYNKDTIKSKIDISIEDDEMDIKIEMNGK